MTSSGMKIDEHYNQSHISIFAIEVMSTAVTVTSTIAMPPSWINVDHLQVRGHPHQMFRVISMDRQKEERRKKRQWQRWKSAMDAALDSVRRQTNILPDIAMPKATSEFRHTPQAAISIASLRSVPSNHAMRFPFLNTGFEFTFAEPRAPIWPVREHNTLPTPIKEEALFHARRLLNKRSISERSTIRRRAIWARKGSTTYHIEHATLL